MTVVPERRLARPGLTPQEEYQQFSRGFEDAWAGNPGTTHERWFTFADTPEGAEYYRAEVRGKAEVGFMRRLLYGRILALTHPIYVSYQE